MIVIGPIAPCYKIDKKNARSPLRAVNWPVCFWQEFVTIAQKKADLSGNTNSNLFLIFFKDKFVTENKLQIAW